MAVDFATLFGRGVSRLFAVHAETVQYLPRGGLPRSVQAVVNRQPPTPENVPEGLVAPRLVLHFKTDATAGILPELIDTGGDQVEVALRAGGTPEKRPITRLVDDDGMTTVWVD